MHLQEEPREDVAAEDCLTLSARPAEQEAPPLIVGKPFGNLGVLGQRASLLPEGGKGLSEGGPKDAFDIVEG